MAPTSALPGMPVSTACAPRWGRTLHQYIRQLVLETATKIILTAPVTRAALTAVLRLLTAEIFHSLSRMIVVEKKDAAASAACPALLVVAYHVFAGTVLNFLVVMTFAPRMFPPMVKKVLGARAAAVETAVTSAVIVSPVSASRSLWHLAIAMAARAAIPAAVKAVK